MSRCGTLSRGKLSSRELAGQLDSIYFLLLTVIHKYTIIYMWEVQVRCWILSIHIIQGRTFIEKLTGQLELNLLLVTACDLLLQCNSKYTCTVHRQRTVARPGKLPTPVQ